MQYIISTADRVTLFGETRFSSWQWQIGFDLKLNFTIKFHYFGERCSVRNWQPRYTHKSKVIISLSPSNTKRRPFSCSESFLSLGQSAFFPCQRISSSLGSSLPRDALHYVYCKKYTLKLSYVFSVLAWGNLHIFQVSSNLINPNST